jgi:hypothetical protein
MHVIHFEHVITTMRATILTSHADCFLLMLIDCFLAHTVNLASYAHIVFSCGHDHSNLTLETHEHYYKVKLIGINNNNYHTQHVRQQILNINTTLYMCKQHYIE